MQALTNNILIFAATRAAASAAGHGQAIMAEGAAHSLPAPAAACLPGPAPRAALSLRLCKISPNPPDFALKRRALGFLVTPCLSSLYRKPSRVKDKSPLGHCDHVRSFAGSFFFSFPEEYSEPEAAFTGEF